MTAAVLSLLALLDGLLIGFRAAAGRSGQVAKTRYYLRAQLFGALGASVVVALAWALALALVAGSADPDQLWRDFSRAGRAALLLFGIYGATAVAAILVYLAASLTSRSIDTRTLATVVVLGPFTLARPAVVVAGLAAALWICPRLEIALLAAFVGAAMLGLERALGRLYRAPLERLLSGAVAGPSPPSGE